LVRGERHGNQLVTAAWAGVQKRRCFRCSDWSWFALESQEPD